MSASWPDNMRGPRVKTPLLLLLLLLTSLTGTVLCQDDEGGDGVSTTEEPEVHPSETSPTSSTSPSDTSLEPGDESTDDEGSGADNSNPVTDIDEGLDTPTSSPGDDKSLDPIIIMIPVVLVVVIIAIIVVCIFIKRRWNKKADSHDLRKEDPYLEDASSEKVPMPMFEEDVPSVLELEMEELDQWMKKDGETAGDSKQA